MSQLRCTLACSSPLSISTVQHAYNSKQQSKQHNNTKRAIAELWVHARLLLVAEHQLVAGVLQLLQDLLRPEKGTPRKLVIHYKPGRMGKGLET